MLYDTVFYQPPCTRGFAAYCMEFCVETVFAVVDRSSMSHLVAVVQCGVHS